MTCIIGMHYDCCKGAIVLSDSRIMLGGDYFREQKLFDIGDSIVFAASGLSGIAQKLMPKVRDTRTRSRKTLPSEVVDIFEDEMAELFNRYKMTRPYRFSNEATLLQGIIGFLDDGKPALHCLHENGYAEVIKAFRVIGHGERHATNILTTLYDPAINRERAIEIAVYALVQVSKVDAMVDAFPQIAVLESGESGPDVTILNETATGFKFECEEIERIKSRLTGIEEKRTQVFHLLLDGSEETKKKFDQALKEYERAKKPSKETESKDATITVGAGA